jgi:hypothetical protein
MKVFARHALSWLLTLCGLLMLGCTNATDRMLDPETIANDFANHPESSVGKYRSLWMTSDEAQKVSVLDRITIAGELIHYDTEHYREYYGLIIRSIESDDDTVAAAAANSLRNSIGSEAIEILFRSLDSGRPALGRAAAHSIAYKMVTLKHSSQSNDELALISKGVSNRCSASSTPEYIRSVICSN